MKIKDERGFLTKKGWEKAERMGLFNFTEEQRMINILLKEIKIRNIFIESVGQEMLFIPKE